MDKKTIKALKAFYYRRLDRMQRRYDDEDESGDSPAPKKKGHANTRLPYGLCQAAGIQVGKEWTPKQAWEALEKGTGVSASEAYGDLKSKGNAAETAKKAAEGKKAKESAQKPKESAKKPKKAKPEFKYSVPEDFPDPFITNRNAKTSLGWFLDGVSKSSPTETMKTFWTNIQNDLSRVAGNSWTLTNVKTLGNGFDSAVVYHPFTGEVEFNVGRLNENSTNAERSIFAHEFAHLADMMKGAPGLEAKHRSAQDIRLTKALKNYDDGGRVMSEDAKKMMAEAKRLMDEGLEEWKRGKDGWKEEFLAEAEKKYGVPLKRGVEPYASQKPYREYPEENRTTKYWEDQRIYYKIQKEYEKKEKEYWKKQYYFRAEKCGGKWPLAALYDDMDMGVHQDNGEIGLSHRGSYYKKDKDNRPTEMLAHYAQLATFFPDELEFLKKDRPEVAEALDHLFRTISNDTGAKAPDGGLHLS